MKELRILNLDLFVEASSQLQSVDIQFEVIYAGLLLNHKV